MYPFSVGKPAFAAGRPVFTVNGSNNSTNSDRKKGSKKEEREEQEEE